MKLVCSQVELNSALQLVSKAVEEKPTHPVLANVKLIADAGTGRLSLTGFNLELGIQTSFAAEVNVSGVTTVPYKLFSEIISRLSSESPITFTVNETDQKIELSSLNGNYSLRAMPADDFPELPIIENGAVLKIKVEALLTALKSTLFASKSDDIKNVLTGVHFNFDETKMEAAATDGHRLSILKIQNALEVHNQNVTIETENDSLLSVTLPHKSLTEVQRLVTRWKSDENISLFLDQGKVVFMASDQILTSRTLEGVYPNYNQLVPNKFDRSINVNRRDFISSLERVAVLANQHNNVIRISTDNSSQIITIITEAQDVGSGLESISAKSTGEAIEIAFNVRYLLDGLKAIDSEFVILRCNSPTTPAILSPTDNKSDFTYLVMPIQVRA